MVAVACGCVGCYKYWQGASMAGKFNKGDISEGILAAAITARFVSKTKPITDNDVVSIIGKLKPGQGAQKGFSSTTKFTSPNLAKNVVDTVICFVNLAEVNMKGFLDTKIYRDKDVKELVTAAVSYANGIHVREWADTMYRNGQKNTIEVRSEGLLDQSGTKVDLRVIIDGKQCGIGVSLKAGDVKQFGQIGGASIESMKDLFEPLGVKFTSTHAKKIETYLMNKKPTEALSFAYSEAYSQLASIIKKDAIGFRKNLAAFMQYHATRNEPNVALVQLAKGQATVYMFEEVKKKLTGVPVHVEYSTGSTDVVPGKKIPQLLFYGGSKDSKNLLIQIRVKLEGNRVDSKGKKLGLTIRNYVEKGTLTTRLIAGH
jgi:hypothetical protein